MSPPYLLESLCFLSLTKQLGSTLSKPLSSNFLRCFFKWVSQWCLVCKFDFHPAPMHRVNKFTAASCSRSAVATPCGTPTNRSSMSDIARKHMHSAMQTSAGMMIKVKNIATKGTKDRPSSAVNVPACVLASLLLLLNNLDKPPSLGKVHVESHDAILL